MENHYRTWCEVSLDALQHNYNQFRKILNKDTKILGVVKADGYGHGSYEVAHVLEQNGADFLGVAFIDEAIELRQRGIKLPILILGYTSPTFADDLVKYDIIPTISSLDVAKKLSDVAKKRNKTAKIHVKIDTGMSRLGFLCNDESVKDIIEISKLSNVEINGIFTHFACADEEDTTLTYKQFSRFCEIIDKLEKANVHIPIKHCCNSAAAMRFPNMHLDMVRVGISLYGLYPSEIKYDLDLIPAMQLKSTVTDIRNIQKDDTVSYGATFKAQSARRIATVSVGYADGYSRVLSNKVKVIVNGEIAPVVGRICMDQCMIDVTDVNNISVEDEVILFGADDKAVIPIEDVANAMGTITYELLCIIGHRVPRCYTQNSRVIHIHNYLLSPFNLH